MSRTELGILSLDEGYFEKIWGGRRLHDALGKPVDPETPIGEAWLVADHPQHGSRVTGGPHEGTLLHDLLARHGDALMGTVAKPTVHGRFPLLLKILDASDYLSVQVHPDDANAERLGEPDVGKTEMWHVLEAEPNSELICGMVPDVTREAFRKASEDGTTPQLLTHFGVTPGTSVFVPAGTVHAIGSGILLAEIQQNSDITYRVDDWGRVQPDGTSRELHIEKSLEVIHFGSKHHGPAEPLAAEADGATRHILSACRYFAAESLAIESEYTRDTSGRSFHIILATSGTLRVADGEREVALEPGNACVISASVGAFRISGPGTALEYYVPDLGLDVIKPLRRAGHANDAIVALGGDPRTSDLAADWLEN